MVHKMTPEEIELRITKTVVLDGCDVEAKRSEILSYFNKTFTIFERLYELLADEEAFQMQPLHKLRHPHIFYYGHTATFFINKMAMAGLTTRINPLYEEMFAIGVDEMQWDDLNAAHYDFPCSRDVKAYRDLVRDRVSNFIKKTQFSLPITWDSPMWIVLMGIEHERIHLETSAVLIRELPIHLVKPHPFWRHCDVTGEAPQNELVKIAGGKVRVGRERSQADGVYGWDVDYGKYEVEVKDFETSKFLVSNKEYKAFIDAGGYSNEGLWTQDGWGWRCFREATLPHFWVQRDDGLKLRLLAEEIDMPWDWPAEVNQHEAKAFCKWLSEKDGRLVRLPTEAEWSLLFDRYVQKDQWEWDEAPGNTNLEKFASSCPVNMFRQGELYDVVGNVWQHTETPTGPLPNFEVHPYYDDFSMPTFDGEHTIQKGGCWLSTGNEATRDARFAFRRHFYQMIGIRYVVGEEVDEYAGFYASDPVCDQYTEFHYGVKTQKLGDNAFPVALAHHVSSQAEKLGVKMGRVADIGCRSGRTSFELARSFEEVQGIDFSARYIMPGCQMRECAQTKWSFPLEGELSEERKAQAADFNLDELVHKTTFWQSDASNLHKHLRGYDVVVANVNLLERLYDPILFLNTIHQRMTEGGLLVVASTYDWQESRISNDRECAARDKWVSGFKDESGVAVRGLEGLTRQLSEHFALVEDPVELEYVFPTSARKAELGTVEVSTWKLVKH